MESSFTKPLVENEYVKKINSDLISVRNLLDEEIKRVNNISSYSGRDESVMVLAGGAARDLYFNKGNEIKDLDVIVWLPTQSDEKNEEFIASLLKRVSFENKNTLPKLVEKEQSQILNPDGTFSKLIRISSIDNVKLNYPVDLIIPPGLNIKYKVQFGLDAYNGNLGVLNNSYRADKNVIPNTIMFDGTYADRLTSSTHLTYLELFDIGLCQIAVEVSDSGLANKYEHTWLFALDEMNKTITIDDRSVVGNFVNKQKHLDHIKRVSCKYSDFEVKNMDVTKRQELFNEFLISKALGINFEDVLSFKYYAAGGSIDKTLNINSVQNNIILNDISRSVNSEPAIYLGVLSNLIKSNIMSVDWLINNVGSEAANYYIDLIEKKNLMWNNSNEKPVINSFIEQVKIYNNLDKSNEMKNKKSMKL